MLNTGLNISKAFREQVEINLDLIFFSKTMRKDKTRFLSLLMLYENMQNIIFKVLSSVVYCIINKYACDDYNCYPQTRLHVENKGF